MPTFHVSVKLIAPSVLIGALLACSSPPDEFPGSNPGQNDPDIPTGFDRIETAVETANTAVESTEPGGPGTPGFNQPPLARAVFTFNDGDGTGLIPGKVISLDGSSSNDIEGDVLSYQWILNARPDGSNTSISNTTFPTAQLYVDRGGIYSVDLVVSDGNAEDRDSLEIEVDNANLPPIANAGPDQALTIGSVAQLTGTGSSDPEGDRLEEYQWTITSKPSGSGASLQGVGVQPALSPRFSVDKAGSYAVELVVIDENGLESVPDTVLVIASDVANPGGGSGGGCAGCSEETQRQVRQAWTVGDAANLGVGLLPLMALFWQRRREAQLAERSQS